MVDNTGYIEEDVDKILTPIDGVSIPMTGKLWNIMLHAKEWIMITSNGESYAHHTHESFVEGVASILADRSKQTGQKWGISALHEECLHQLQHNGFNIIMIAIKERKQDG